MRKIGLFCVIVPAILGLCMVSPVAGEQPGDKLVEVFKKDVEPEESLIPAGVVIEKEFKPGKGSAIGTVETIKGRVLTIHRGEKTAYALKKKYELFTYDTLISEEESNAHIKFNDGSFITLGTYTKLVLDKSIYDPSKTTRDSFVRLLFGKARFIVTKLVNFRSSKYKVKTPTAVVGVRGSDFAVSVAYGSPLVTTLMTGKDTTVIFAGDIGPPQVIGPLQASSATEGGAAGAGMNVTRYPPEISGLGGTSNLVYWAGGIAGAALIGGAILSGDGGSGSGALTVSESPPEFSALAGLDVPNPITFSFSKPIATVTAANFLITNTIEPWIVDSVSMPNQQTAVVVVTNSNSIPGEGFIFDLVNIVATDQTPLTGQTTFQYNAGG